MDKGERRWLTKEVGLEASYRFFKFTTGTEYLHFGLFEPDIPRDFQHLREAQERYLERLIEIFPAGTKSILDVGAGSGKTAEVLIERGFQVDCVSPGKILGDMVADRLKGKATLYRGRFEDVIIPKHYDLVLFSESFQYIPIPIALTKAISVLKPGGHILICDFFHKPEAGKSAVGGGHSYPAWLQHKKKAPLKAVIEKDITSETAPVLDLINAFNLEVFKPVAESAAVVAAARWPTWTRIVTFFFRRDIAKLKRKRFSGKATGEEFKRAKVYKTYLLKHQPG